jgi:hypothetical protein
MVIIKKTLYQICNVLSRYAFRFGFKNLATKSKGRNAIIHDVLTVPYW